MKLNWASLMPLPVMAIMVRGMRAVNAAVHSADVQGAAAQAGADGTAQMTAKKGRSSRLGDRSVRHRDPGAASMGLLLQAAEQALTEAHCYTLP